MAHAGATIYGLLQLHGNNLDSATTSLVCVERQILALLFRRYRAEIGRHYTQYRSQQHAYLLSRVHIASLKNETLGL